MKSFGEIIIAKQLLLFLSWRLFRVLGTFFAISPCAGMWIQTTLYCLEDFRTVTTISFDAVFSLPLVTRNIFKHKNTLKQPNHVMFVMCRVKEPVACFTHRMIKKSSYCSFHMQANNKMRLKWKIHFFKNFTESHVFFCILNFTEVMTMQVT